MSAEILQQALELTAERQLGAAMELLKPIIEEKREDDNYYRCLKLYADIIGPLSGSDNVLAIDIYQQILSQTEDDNLYNSVQVAILKANLMLSIHFMEAFENTIDVIEVAEHDRHFVEDLIQKRENFITKRADLIFKQKL